MKIRSTKTTLLGLGAAFALAGCNVGMAPDPMTREQAQGALANMSPQDQIKYYQTGPMPADQKAKKIAEIEQKYGIKADASGPPKTGP